jgi:hypothetical membrane protein
LMRPGYDQLSQYGSELSTGPNAIIMNANFLAAGLLIIAFAAGLFRSIQGGRWLRMGSALLGVCGAGEAVTALFPCDPGCPLAAESFSQLAHNADAVVAFVALALAPLLISTGLKQNRYWQGYQHYSFVTGLATIGLFSIFSAASLGYLGFVGLLQRLFLAVPFLWIEVMATKLLRASSYDPPRQHCSETRAKLLGNLFQSGSVPRIVHSPAMKGWTRAKQS